MKLSIEQLLLDSRIRIYAPVTQKWPMRPRLVDSIPFNVGDHNFFAAHRPVGNDFAAWKNCPPLVGFTVCFASG